MSTRQDIVEAEVSQLKRELKRQRWINVGLLMFGLVGASAITAKTQSTSTPAPQDLVVRSLKVVGPDGSERVLLESGQDFGHISIVNSQQKRVVALSGHKYGGSISVLDQTAKPAVGLMSLPATGGGVMVFAKENEQGLPVAVLMSDGKNGRIEVSDSKGSILETMPSSAKGSE